MIALAAAAVSQVDVAPAAPPEWMKFTIAVLVGLAIYNLVNFAKYVRHGDLNGVATHLMWIAIGVVFAFWLSHTELTQNMVFIDGGPALKDLDFGGLMLLAVGIGSIAPTVADFRSAFDGTDSARKPALVTGPAE